MKKILRVLLVVVLAMTLTACSSEDKVEERQLVSENKIESIVLENRAWTNGYGGVRGYNPYICYIFLDDNGTICYDEHQLHEDYDGYVYEMCLYSTSDENKLMTYEKGNKTIYEIYLTQETYQQLLTSEINPQS